MYGLHSPCTPTYTRASVSTRYLFLIWTLALGVLILLESFSIRAPILRDKYPQIWEIRDGSEPASGFLYFAAKLWKCSSLRRNSVVASPNFCCRQCKAARHKSWICPPHTCGPRLPAKQPQLIPFKSKNPAASTTCWRSSTEKVGEKAPVLRISVRASPFTRLRAPFSDPRP